MTKKIGWTEWLSKSNFSFLAGASHPHEMIEKAGACEYRAMAVNDYDGVYGLARSAIEHKKQKQNYKLLHGAELRLNFNKDQCTLMQDSLVAIARNSSGYKQLNQIINYSHRDSKTETKLNINELRDFKTEDLLFLQPMRGLIRKGIPKTQYELRKEILKDYHLCVSRHLHPAEDQFIKKQLQLAEDLNLKTIYSQDAFFHSAGRKPMSDLLHSIRTNLPIHKACAHFFPNAERHLHKLDDIHKLYSPLPNYEESLLLSKSLTDEIDFGFGELKYQYPKEMIPEGYTAQSYLAALTWEGAKKRFGEQLTERVRQALHHELELIEHLGYADYFLTVWDIVRWARSQNILCQGRGSAANSSVCYVLEITAVNPNHFDLLFERFMSKERGDPPDIDVDFEHERREEVIQYIYERYGRARAAMVANVICFQKKGAMRAVGKAFGFSEDILKNAANLYSSKAFRGKSTGDIINNVKEEQEVRSLAQEVLEEENPTNSHYPNLDKHPREQKHLTKEHVKEITEKKSREQIKAETKAHYSLNPYNDNRLNIKKLDSEFAPFIDEEERIEDILKQNYELWTKLSEELTGFPRHLGIHSGGFIIAQNTLDELVAQEPASMEGRTVIQWCKEDIEALGFFKIDVLALGMLTAIRKCFTDIAEKYQNNLDLYNIPADDHSTYTMIQKADTVGVFQIESRAQMSMLPRLKPKNFYDLVIEIAIIRPGPIQGGIIHPFLKRRQGLEPVVFPSEKLRPILSKTLGVTIFQEQAMRIAIEVGDFTAGEANELRKNIGAWNMPGHSQNLPPMLEKLERGMRKNGIEENFIKSLLQQMKGFAEYGFPESHAISFAFLAYASCYLKCHYPAAFFTSILNSQPMGFYSPHALLQAAKRDGVSLFPVSIQYSDWDHKLEAVHGKEPPLYGIRMGFRLVKSLSSNAVERILEARKKAGPFKSFEDFLSRCLLYRDELTALAASDCFSVFGLSRKEAIWLSEALPIKPLVEQEERKLYWRKEGKFEQIEKDFKSFQTSLKDHPVKLVKDSYWPYKIPKERIIASNQFSKVIRNQVIHIFGMILVRQAPPSAKGMVFVTLEDEYGFINLAISPQVYQKFYPLIERQAFVCVEAKMQKEGESHSLWVKRFSVPESGQEIIDLDDYKEKLEEKKLRAQGKFNKKAIQTKKVSSVRQTKDWIKEHKLKFKQLRELTSARNYH